MHARQFGKYTLLEHMGKGGVASVYRATDGETGQIVAVKIFATGPDRTPDVSRQFRDREVKMLVSVQHPNIVTFFESGDVGDDAYYAMEFVEDSLLRCMREEEEFDLADKVHILRQSASALVAIHRQGIVHRDIKPGNILLDRDSNGAIHVKLTDLGIARNVSEIDILRTNMPARVAGTARYLSPEQIKRTPMDGRSDIFSLGVLAYELLTGARPFQASDSRGYLTANVEQEPRPIDEICPDVPRFLAQMVERMLAKDREERYDAETLARDLELVEQHLISGATLVETVNPASLFYDSTDAETMEPLECEPEPGLDLKTKLAAMAIVLLGGVVTILLWPGAPAAVGDDSGPDQDAVVAQSPLERAADALEAGRRWQAFAILQGLADTGLSESDSEAAEQLSAQVQEALAEEHFRLGLRMLEEGRDAEAEVVLQGMKDLFPDAPQTKRLDAQIRDREQRASAEQHWERALAESYDLVKKRRYADALAARKALLREFAGDPEKAATARRAVGDLLEQWARDLAGGTDVEAIREFLGIVRAEGSAQADRPTARALGELHLKLGAAYRTRNEYGKALEQYDLAGRMADADVADRARTQADQLRNWLRTRPQEIDEVAAELTGDPFRGSIWNIGTNAETGARIVDGVLQLRSVEGNWQSTVSVETARPIRHYGFALGVQFRTTPSVMVRTGVTRAGIELTDSTGNTCRFFFDGERYRFSRQSRLGSAEAPVQAAVGDEGGQWHTMSMRYDGAAHRLAVLLDGVELRHYALDLSEIRVRLFLDGSTDLAAGCDFKGFYCRP